MSSRLTDFPSLASVDRRSEAIRRVGPPAVYGGVNTLTAVSTPGGVRCGSGGREYVGPL